MTVVNTRAYVDHSTAVAIWMKCTQWFICLYKVLALGMANFLTVKLHEKSNRKIKYNRNIVNLIFVTVRNRKRCGTHLKKKHINCSRIMSSISIWKQCWNSTWYGLMYQILMVVYIHVYENFSHWEAYINYSYWQWWNRIRENKRQRMSVFGILMKCVTGLFLYHYIVVVVV